MRRCISLVCLFVFLTAGLVCGQGCQAASQGGFQGPSAYSTVTTAEQARKAPNDMHVVLVGHIVHREASDHEHYLFRDSTGEIIVDIDDKLFMGRTVTPTTKIRIYGEVDRDPLKPVKIDVDGFDIL